MNELQKKKVVIRKKYLKKTGWIFAKKKKRYQEKVLKKVNEYLQKNKIIRKKHLNKESEWIFAKKSLSQKST